MRLDGTPELDLDTDDPPVRGPRRGCCFQNSRQASQKGRRTLQPLVFKDPSWTYSKRPVNFDSDIDTAETPAHLAINHTNPDLSGFVNHGSKLMLVGGWVDDLQPQNVVSYYESVVKTMGADRVRNAVRLSMVPGMHHCFGGTFPGAYKVDFDPVQAVRQWRTTGRAPDQIVVMTSGLGWPTRKRLVCAYPQVSKYKGSGSTDDPGNFACRAQ